MRLITIFLIGVLIVLSNCKFAREKNSSDVDKLLLVTDSLLITLQNQYDFTSEKLYLLSDDSTKVDSLSRLMIIPDSIGYYQFFEQTLNTFNEIFIRTQEEIYFAKDQLSSLKYEYLNNDISELEYEKEIAEFKEIIQFLSERVDSNIFLINSKYYPFFFTSNDSVLQ
ncbi:hypothetical protein ACFLSE_04985 [Bacteroidota bacterium]